jgi:hypothetical protein
MPLRQANLLNATAAAKILGMQADTDWVHVAQNIPILKMANGVTRSMLPIKARALSKPM